MVIGLAATSLVCIQLAGLSNVEWVGRVAVDAEGGRFQWPASGFAFDFDGRWVEATLEDSAPGSAHAVAGTQSNALAYRIDGGDFNVLTLKPGRHTYRLGAELQEGRHRLEVFKRTESSVGWVRLSDVSAERVVLPMRTRPSRRLLEIIGDSNSCGYGVEATGREVPYSPSTQDATKTYSFLATDSSGWELRMISCSGWGVVRGYGGQTETNMPRVYDRVLIDEPSMTAKGPDATVILVMLGDNDFAQGDPGEVFDLGLRAFVQRLRERTSGAEIWLGVGPMMRDSDEKITRSRVGAVIDSIVSSSEGRVKRVDFPVYDGGWGWGADWHFSTQAHQEIGRFLERRLKAFGH